MIQRVLIKDKGWSVIGFLVVLMFFMAVSELRAEAVRSIGYITAVQRDALVIHEGKTKLLLVKQGDGVQFLDTYETKEKSRLKLLFEDDSLLTLGEKTRLQVTEKVFDPDKDKRSSIFNLVGGTIRALVGKRYEGEGSKFEIHTSSAVAAARGTYFIVWTMGGSQKQTGVVNIGDEGLVEVFSADPLVSGSVMLTSNEYTILNEGQPPSKPIRIGPGLMQGLLADTDLREKAVDQLKEWIELPNLDQLLEPVGSVIVDLVLLKESLDYPSLPPIKQVPDSTDISAGAPPPLPPIETTTPLSVTVTFPD